MDKSDDRDALELALRLLASELERRIHSHPQSHLLVGSAETVELEVRLPISTRDGWLDRSRGQASDSMDEGLRHALLHQAAFRPGRVYCLRCASAKCEHSVPHQATHVFAGYGPSGVPRGPTN